MTITNSSQDSHDEKAVPLGTIRYLTEYTRKMTPTDEPTGYLTDAELDAQLQQAMDIEVPSYLLNKLLSGDFS